MSWELCRPMPARYQLTISKPVSEVKQGARRNSSDLEKGGQPRSLFHKEERFSKRGDVHAFPQRRSKYVDHLKGQFLINSMRSSSYGTGDAKKNGVYLHANEKESKKSPMKLEPVPTHHADEMTTHTPRAEEPFHSSYRLSFASVHTMRRLLDPCRYGETSIFRENTFIRHPQVFNVSPRVHDVPDHDKREVSKRSGSAVTPHAKSVAFKDHVLPEGASSTDLKILPEQEPTAIIRQKDERETDAGEGFNEDFSINFESLKDNGSEFSENARQIVNYLETTVNFDKGLPDDFHTKEVPDGTRAPIPSRRCNRRHSSSPMRKADDTLEEQKLFAKTDSVLSLRDKLQHSNAFIKFHQPIVLNVRELTKKGLKSKRMSRSKTEDLGLKESRGDRLQLGEFYSTGDDLYFMTDNLEVENGLTKSPTSQATEVQEIAKNSINIPVQPPDEDSTDCQKEERAKTR